MPRGGGRAVAIYGEESEHMRDAAAGRVRVRVCVCVELVYKLYVEAAPTASA